MSSPLRSNYSSANRGVPERASRKRGRGNGDDGTSSIAAPSSPLASSPPAPFVAHGGDDDEDIEDDPEILDDLDDMDEMAEDDVDLFREGFERDYRAKEDDRYEGLDIDDDGDFDDMDLGARRRLESQLNRRDREVARRQRIPAAFLPGEDDEGDIDLSAQPRRRRHHYDEDPDEDMDADILEEELSLEALQDAKAASLTEWVSQPNVQRTIKREFKAFLTEYTDEHGSSVYGNRIRTLGEVNAESLEVSYDHLSSSQALLAYYLANAPAEVLKLFDEVAMDVVLLHYPDYERIHSEIHVRIFDLPVHYTLRQLRQSHLNCLVRVSGVVTKRTGVFPQLKYVKFDCTKCGITLGPFQQESNVEVKISYCQSCQSRGPFTLNSEKTVYRNYQKLTLQESPGTVPAGRLPRHREVILLWDLIDKAKPGEEIEVTGIYQNNYDAQLNNRNGFPVFATILEANNVVKSHDQLAGFRMTEEDEQEIRKLSRDPAIIDKIINSIAPSIYGHTDIKTAVALSLFGGVAKVGKGAHQVRGDINVLLLGDPGTAKSQVLKYVEKTAHRAVFATGQGASAVGLTASVRRDPITSEWTLEGGALVLADKGTCLIDEFDKMNDQDRTSIHEAMEQQTISISKAGIVTTLQARCGIIAAANPIGGRYNSTIPFSANVELTEPILSRFDILCVVRDTVEPSEDERLARFIVGSHSRSHPASSQPAADSMDVEQESEKQDTQAETQKKEGEIPQELLRKYILYARERVSPKLYHMDEDKVARLFADMRRESLATGAYPITVRHLEAIIRISEAFCRMRLSEYCSAQDIDRAIAVTVDSFVGSQKISCKKALARAFAKYTLARPGGNSQKKSGIASQGSRRAGTVRA
ncbi:DNA replication licensing factor mcm2 [Colletotrichum sp. SAR11_59]|uniref:DNA replication licensing factor MCM2 n=2 Tax=Colletotrichum gloeosporioides species complex TaxID=2707338 RepID=A0A8H4CP66_COLGL|nr:DNA replication licensing factor mcm2 [Colletotrichum gloeosporioides]KAF0315535.1 MCM2/3/5 family protein [Colletotrichum asianum]KAF4810331.1 DNA replication licensing factor mcm2 [Colletotrichum siamense]KAF4837076.1 DNA replication licensing factor mcm2 [Colletotrichum tropicale]KAI8232935.1 DNA replication licensing factor mcm2 [Colletotrichum sp. SAR 10_96]KAI8257433.1 DNA replication licensing factor mcm2 [Colletotrichum sp. SAR11_239]KAI8277102.1 DNA replication licensing factor mc